AADPEPRKIHRGANPPLLNTRLGQYLRQHPFFGLTALLFSATAALPVGLFVLFALVTLVVSAVAFVFFEGKR
uniref:Uncharacterized protein n=1 Tax=Neogobius melanostomus TaxID=47308 RepID=A0A8C6TMJ1_9GOBI